MYNIKIFWKETTLFAKWHANTEAEAIAFAQCYINQRCSRYNRYNWRFEIEKGE